MDYGLEGKVAIVTGTASQIGIGRAVCLTLAKEGCDIVSADINLEGAEQTASAVRSLGRRAIAVKVDVSEGPETDEMANAALKEYGKIDILINAAGLSASGPVPFLEAKQETWERDMAVNVYGTMHCSKAVIPAMLEQKYGKIVNFSSIAARVGLLGSYSPAKAAVLAFTRGLATQYGPDGINVNAVAPGVVATNFFGPLGDRTAKMFEGMASRVPMRRIQTVEDVANAVAFLVSDVSKNITGQCLQVDSGMVMP